MTLELLGIAGAIASIIGAWWAWKSARNASRAASEADMALTEIRTRSTLGEVSELIALERQAVAAMAKYGPGSTPEAVAGADMNRDAHDVRSYLATLKRHRLIFGDRHPNDADRLCTKGFELLEHIAAAKKFEQKRNAASSLYVELSGFSYLLKSQYDVHRLGFGRKESALSIGT